RNKEKGERVLIMTHEDDLTDQAMGKDGMGQALNACGSVAGFITRDADGNEVGYIYEDGKRRSAPVEEVYKKCETIYAKWDRIVHRYLFEAIGKLPPAITRNKYFALFDEADLMLIFGSSTPAVISGGTDDNWAARLDARMKINDLAAGRILKDEKLYYIRPGTREIFLTRAGEKLARSAVDTSSVPEWETFVIDALKAHRFYREDVNYYAVRNSKGEVTSVGVIDEHTKTRKTGMTFGEGLQQAIEIMAGVTGEKVSPETDTLISMTIGGFLDGSGIITDYAGASGTMETERFKELYPGKEVVEIAGESANLDKKAGHTGFATVAEKRGELIERLKKRFAASQPVMIKAESDVDAREMSALIRERLSGDIERYGIRINVADGSRAAEFGALMEEAGYANVVTIVTNVAHRGVDIQIKGRCLNPDGTPGPEAPPIGEKAPGLHVISAYLDEAEAFEIQTQGRADRGVNRGSWEGLFSLDEDLFTEHADLLDQEMVALRRAIKAGEPAKAQLERHVGSVRGRIIARKNRNDARRLEYENEVDAYQRSLLNIVDVTKDQGLFIAFLYNIGAYEALYAVLKPGESMGAETDTLRLAVRDYVVRQLSAFQTKQAGTRRKMDYLSAKARIGVKGAFSQIDQELTSAVRLARNFKSRVRNINKFILGMIAVKVEKKAADVKKKEASSLKLKNILFSDGMKTAIAVFLILATGAAFAIWGVTPFVNLALRPAMGFLQEHAVMTGAATAAISIPSLYIRQIYGRKISEADRSGRGFMRFAFGIGRGSMAASFGRWAGVMSLQLLAIMGLYGGMGTLITVIAYPDVLSLIIPNVGLGAVPLAFSGVAASFAANVALAGIFRAEFKKMRDVTPNRFQTGLYEFARMLLFLTGILFVIQAGAGLSVATISGVAMIALSALLSILFARRADTGYYRTLLPVYIGGLAGIAAAAALALGAAFIGAPAIFAFAIPLIKLTIAVIGVATVSLQFFQAWELASEAKSSGQGFWRAFFESFIPGSRNLIMYIIGVPAAAFACGNIVSTVLFAIFTAGLVMALRSYSVDMEKLFGRRVSQVLAGGLGGAVAFTSAVTPAAVYPAMAHAGRVETLREGVRRGKPDKTFFEELRSTVSYYSPQDMAGLKRLRANITSVLDDIMSGMWTASKPAEVEESVEGAPRAPTAVKQAEETKPAAAKTAGVKASKASEKILSVLSPKSELKDIGSPVMTTVTRLAPAQVPAKPTGTKPAKPIINVSAAIAAVKARVAPALPSRSELKDIGSSVIKAVTRLAPAAGGGRLPSVEPVEVKPTGLTKPAEKMRPAESAKPVDATKPAEKVLPPAAPAQQPAAKQADLVRGYDTERAAYEEALAAKDYKKAFESLDKCFAALDALVKSGKDEWAGPLKQLKETVHPWLLERYRADRPAEFEILKSQYSEIIRAYNKSYDDYIKAEKAGDPEKARSCAFSCAAGLRHLIKEKDGLRLNPGLRELLEGWESLEERLSGEDRVRDEAALKSPRAAATEPAAAQVTRNAIESTARTIAPKVAEFFKARGVTASPGEMSLMTKWFATYAVTHAVKSVDLGRYIDSLIAQWPGVESLREGIAGPEGKSVESLGPREPFAQNMIVLPMAEMDRVEKILLKFKTTVPGLGLHSYIARLSMGDGIGVAAHNPDMEFLKNEAKSIGRERGYPVNFNDPFDLGMMVAREHEASSRKETAAHGSEFTTKAFTWDASKYDIDRVEMLNVCPDGPYGAAGTNVDVIRYEMQYGRGAYPAAVGSKDGAALASTAPEFRARLQNLFSDKEIAELRENFPDLKISRPDSPIDAIRYMCMRLYGRNVAFQYYDKGIIISWLKFAHIRCMSIEDLKKLMDTMRGIRDLIEERYGPVTDDDIKAANLYGEIAFYKRWKERDADSFRDAGMEPFSDLLITMTKDMVRRGQEAYWAEFILYGKYAPALKELNITPKEFLAAIFAIDKNLKDEAKKYGIKALAGADKVSEGRRMSIAIEIYIASKQNGKSAWLVFLNKDGLIKGITGADKKANGSSIDNIFGISANIHKEAKKYGIDVLAGDDKFSEGRRMAIAMNLVELADEIKRGARPSGWAVYFNLDGSLRGGDQAAGAGSRDYIIDIFKTADTIAGQKIPALEGDDPDSEGRRMAIAMDLVRNGMNSAWSRYICIDIQGREDGTVKSEGAKKNIDMVFAIVSAKDSRGIYFLKNELLEGILGIKADKITEGDRMTFVLANLANLIPKYDAWLELQKQQVTPAPEKEAEAAPPVIVPEMPAAPSRAPTILASSTSSTTAGLITTTEEGQAGITLVSTTASTTEEQPEAAQSQTPQARTYDQYQALPMDNVMDDKIWVVGAKPTGYVYNQPIKLFVWNENANKYGEAQYKGKDPIGMINISHKVAGQEIWPTILALHGAGYVRFSAEPPLTMGATLRIGAIRAGEKDQEFPRVTEAWMKRISASQYEIRLRVDSSTYSGVVVLTVTPGAKTTVGVQASYKMKRDVDMAKEPNTGFIGFATMYGLNPNTKTPAHDTDTVRVVYDDGTADTRGLINPSKRISIGLGKPGATVKVFSLNQEDRRPDTYKDAGAKYENRCSYAVTIGSSNIPLTLRVNVDPTQTDNSDNVYPVLVSQQNLTAGQEISLVYEVTANRGGLAELQAPAQPASAKAPAARPKVRPARPKAKVDLGKWEADMKIQGQIVTNLSRLDRYFPGDTDEIKAIRNGIKNALAQDLMANPKLWAPLFMNADGTEAPEGSELQKRQQKNLDDLFGTAAATKAEGVIEKLSKELDAILKDAGFTGKGQAEGAKITMASRLIRARPVKDGGEGVSTPWTAYFNLDGSIRGDTEQERLANRAELKRIFDTAGKIYRALVAKDVEEIEASGIAMALAMNPGYINDWTGAKWMTVIGEKPGEKVYTLTDDGKYGLDTAKSIREAITAKDKEMDAEYAAGIATTLSMYPAYLTDWINNKWIEENRDAKGEPDGTYTLTDTGLKGLREAQKIKKVLEGAGTKDTDAAGIATTLAMNPGYIDEWMKPDVG
ncbi:MAG: glucan biosynthesis protein, partial [Candidatus Omnitrophica bacterium]|nr:glucan biosynthesis protein [Candidatus Omnitrophota bacterium]